MRAEHKKILKGIVLGMRHLLEGRYDAEGRWRAGDLEQRLAAIGIRREREPVPLDELPHLPDQDRRARRVVEAYLALRKEAGIGIAGAVAEFVRETAYTWTNRLLALRCMEARQLIDGVILQEQAYGGRSLEHHRLALRQPEACLGEDDGLFLARWTGSLPKERRACRAYSIRVPPASRSGHRRRRSSSASAFCPETAPPPRFSRRRTPWAGRTSTTRRKKRRGSMPG